MGLLSIIKSIITFPFRLIGMIFGRKKESVGLESLPPPQLPPPPQPTTQPLRPEPARVEYGREYPVGSEEINKTKLDLIIAELDILKSMSQTLNERLKLIERRLEEKERGIRYV